MVVDCPCQPQVSIDSIRVYHDRKVIIGAIGGISSIPWFAGAIGTVTNGMHSDRTGERRWHIAFQLLRVLWHLL